MLAKALVLAVIYIEQRNSSCTEDNDVRVLEEIASMIAGASEDERQSFIDAAAVLGASELPEQLGLVSP
ncbi:hypothetical protein [Rhodanobacter sp. Root627]|uniref:hypothetical protein n=1 Tax=Rhodanobacter sp. Root627 TaxID=1736572 RepID=UPI0012E3599E|nr:hypothetical protein [Rhodanobacter sp. Root627]